MTNKIKLNTDIFEYDPLLDGTDPDREWTGMPPCVNSPREVERKIIVTLVNEQAVRDFERMIGQPITSRTKSIQIPRAEKLMVHDLFWVSDED